MVIIIFVSDLGLIRMVDKFLQYIKYVKTEKYP